MNFIIKFSMSYWYHLHVGQGTFKELFAMVCTFVKQAIILQKIGKLRIMKLSFSLADRSSRVYAREVDR